jgi:hypothetical protein
MFNDRSSTSIQVEGAPPAPVTILGGPTRARHASGAVSTPGRLVWRIVRTGRLLYPILLLSDQGRMILERKYDAFVTDRAYENAPHGRLGPIGRAVDAYVLRFPVHEAIRQRLPMVVGALEEGVAAQGVAGAAVRVLSAPCGLGRDVLEAASRLRHPGHRVRVAWTGVDIDESGTVLEETAHRATEAQVPITLLREDLFADRSALSDHVRHEGRFHVVSCIGLASWLDLADLARLTARFRDLAQPGATLLIDNFRRHKHSHLGSKLEIPTRYHVDRDMGSALSAGGWTPIEMRESENGIATLWIARRAK